MHWIRWVLVLLKVLGTFAKFSDFFSDVKIRLQTSLTHNSLIARGNGKPTKATTRGYVQGFLVVVFYFSSPLFSLLPSFSSF